MISQTAEYALRAIVYLADQGVRELGARTTLQIADATQVPAGYLAKVMKVLSRAKLVRSQRGVHGGYVLISDPRQLTVLDVINLVDPFRRFPECPLGSFRHGRHLCPLHQRLDNAAQAVESAFCQTAVLDLVEGPCALRSVCPIPVAQQRPRERVSVGPQFRKARPPEQS